MRRWAKEVEADGQGDRQHEGGGCSARVRSSCSVGVTTMERPALCSTGTRAAGGELLVMAIVCSASTGDVVAEIAQSERYQNIGMLSGRRGLRGEKSV